VIAEVDRHQVGSSQDLQKAIQQHPKGSPLLLLVHREDQSVYLAVTL